MNAALNAIRFTLLEVVELGCEYRFDVPRIAGG